MTTTATWSTSRQRSSAPAFRNAFSATTSTSNLGLERPTPGDAASRRSSRGFQPAGSCEPRARRYATAFSEKPSCRTDAKLAEIDRQLSQKEAERATVAATISKFEATVPLLELRVEIRKYLLEKDLGYLTDLADLTGNRHDLLVHKSRYQEAEAAVAALTETRAKTAAEYRRGWKIPADLLV
jgi:membrane fusion protein, hemolysin D